MIEIVFVAVLVIGGVCIFLVQAVRSIKKKKEPRVITDGFGEKWYLVSKGGKGCVVRKAGFPFTDDSKRHNYTLDEMKTQFPDYASEWEAIREGSKI